MIIISPLLDSFVLFRLKNKNYRKKIFELALQKKLRKNKMGHIILRNLGDAMAADPSLHKEFSEMNAGQNYQKIFWESDLGYLWYEGNIQAPNIYFEFAKEQIAKNKYETVLDVGCGWGRFCAEVMAMESTKNVTGIDISEDIIRLASEKHSDTGVTFLCRDVIDEKGKYDLITLFGSTDYIPPDVFKNVLTHIIGLANKEIIIVNSLRKIPFEESLKLEKAMEITRYDDGYLQPLNYLLSEIKKNVPISYKIIKYGQDSVIATIYKA